MKSHKKGIVMNTIMVYFLSFNWHILYKQYNTIHVYTCTYLYYNMQIKYSINVTLTQSFCTYVQTIKYYTSENDTTYEWHLRK